jgi:signal transduction histidine kinase
VYRIRWRRDFIIPVTFVVMVGVLALVLLQMDRLYYQNGKYEIIRSRPAELIPFNRSKLSKLTKQALDSPPSSSARRFYVARLREAGQELLGPSTPFYFFQVLDAQDPNNPLLTMEVDKFRSNNTWENSLFLRDFSRSTDVMIEGLNQDEPPAGRYVLRFTTPRNSIHIEALTVTWRWRSLFIAISFFAFYGAILKGILLPVRRVIACLERVDRVAPRILNRPDTLLERAYNNLARDASLTQLASRLRDRIADEPALDPQGLLDRIPRDLIVYFGFEGARFWTLRADEGGSLWTLERIHPQGPGSGSASSPDPVAEYVRREIAATPPRDLETRWSDHLAEIREERGTSQTVFFSLVDRRKDPDTVTVVSIPSQRGRSGTLTPWERETFRLVADQIGIAIDSLTAQRRLILQEKSKANISLSRNLGHDLTNIIATGKLDIMTVRRFLNIPPERWVSSPQKEEIFRTSLHALLNNSRFLQEIVNIYRSFSYLSRPRFEWVDARSLVSDIVELFRLSLSRAIQVRIQMPESVSPCLMEPRLVKLALFNLLTNAADSVKRAFSSDSLEEGNIEITVEEDGEVREIRIAVADSGTGILDEDGKPLSAAEMDRVFHLGYSTKDNQEGEGLGLNWVHSIIADFHAGRVLPRNRPEGGAEFSLYLRLDGPPESQAESSEEKRPPVGKDSPETPAPSFDSAGSRPAVPTEFSE